MILSDFHVHTRYCDGKNSPEEIVCEAISRGMKKIGFSGHSYTPFDPEPCMSPEKTEEYRREISRLKEKYASQIKIFCGIEHEYYSQISTKNFDYVIGSVHYIFCDGKYLHVDNTEKMFSDMINAFGGGVYSVVEKYFSLAADVVNKTGANIIGHFDLITKLNAGNKFFDENHERYINAWRNAADVLIGTGKIFEINTGAVSRGYRQFPFPAQKILEYIAEKGGSVILSSDAHRKENLMYEFEKYEGLAKSLGLKVVEL